MIIKKIAAEATFKIRQEVLRKNIPLAYEFQGDYDKNTLHLGAFYKDKLIAVASFMKASDQTLIGSQYQLRGMATLNEYRGYGAGRSLLQEAGAILKEMNVDLLWCNARIIAVSFYEKLGMQRYGEAFEIEYIGTHYKMFKTLK